MRIKNMLITLTIVLSLFGTANADIVNNNFIGFGSIENCSAGVSIDGDYAAVMDDYRRGVYPLYLYHFPTRTLTPVETRDVSVDGASISGTKIAYIYTGGNIAIYDIKTGETTETGITSVRWYRNSAMRFFDGKRIVFTQGNPTTIKYYTLSTGQVTDTGVVGSTPNIDGNTISFTGRDENNVQCVAFYTINTGQTTFIEPGGYPVLAGNVIAYVDGRSGEVKYYLLDSGTTNSTGITGICAMSTDGRSIAIGPYNASVKVFDIATGAIHDTGEWPCSGGDPCWLEIEGKYIATERYEGGTEYRTPDGQYIEIYPPTDYNGNGYTGYDCAGGWFVWPAELPPTDAIEIIMEELNYIDMPAGTRNSLEAKLAIALKKLLDDNERNDIAATNSLEAFLNGVDAQEGVHISSEDAAYLRESVTAIIQAL
jgi:WD40 repeat protein